MEEFVFDFNKCGVKSTASKEEVQKVVIDFQRRKELEKKALSIVNYLIEGQLQPETFLRCLKRINQAYYDDVVQERSLSKLCGYSLCDKPITKTTTQKYSIDLKRKAVFDASDLQKFCSVFCYSASNYIREQINDGWDKQTNATELQLLNSNKRAFHGKEIFQLPHKPSEEVNFVSVSTVAQMSLFDEINNSDVKVENSTSKKVCKNKNIQVMETLEEGNEDSKSSIETVSENLFVNSVGNDIVNKKQNYFNENSKANVAETNIINTDEDAVVSGKLVSGTVNPKHTSTTFDKIDKSKKVKSKTKREKLGDVLNIITKSIFEWITIDTYSFLYGKEKIKDILNTEQLSKQFESLDCEKASDELKEKYTKVIYKLKLNELEDEKFDKNVIGKALLKPLPNYDELQAQADYNMLKIRAWCGGAFYNRKIDDSEEGHKEIKQDEVSDDIEKDQLFENTTSIQKTRHKIYIKSILPAMTKLTQNLDMPTDVVIEELSLLVETFCLDAQNILFKPVVWTVLSLILIKILSIRNLQLRETLDSPRSKICLQSIYNFIPGAKAQIEELIEKIADFNLFLKNYLLTNQGSK